MEHIIERVLVTGATGFIGRQLCRHLRAGGVWVRALVRRWPADSGATAAGSCWDEAVTCRLGEEAISDRALAGIDTVFHLAGLAHSEQPIAATAQEYWSVNLKATEELLHKAADAGVKRFVFFSSVKAATDPPAGRCVDEEWDGRPTDAYGLSKRCAEEKVVAIGTSRGMHVCNLRPVLVYGPGVKGNFRKMIEAIAAGRFPPVPAIGNKRSLVHVDDLVEAALLVALNPVAHGRTYIVTDGHAYSTRELYVWICQALGKPVPGWQVPKLLLEVLARTGDLAQRATGRRLPFNSEVLEKLSGWAWYSSRQLERELGFQPRWHLPEALPAIIRSLPCTRA